MGFFTNIFKKKEKESVGGMEDFMTLIRVYFQSVIASSYNISNLKYLPDMAAFKRSLHIATVNNKLGIGEKKACSKMLKDLYGISDSFFTEIDRSIKKGCKNQNDVNRYMFQFQGFTQELMMVIGNELKWKFRIPSFMRKLLKKVTDQTVHDIYTKNGWADAGVARSVMSIRKYQQILGFTEDWTKEYVFNLITLAKQEPQPSQDDIDKAEAKMNKH